MLQYLGLSSAAPASTLTRTGRASRTLKSRQNLQDPWDQSWIQKWAAIGDSYSAGIGAGKLMDEECSRYDQSYPQFIETDPDLGEFLDREFSYLACSGATSKTVLSDQIPHVGDGQDVITLSAGGNDVGLVDVLDQCVFQFSALFQQCADVLMHTETKLEQDLPGNLDALLTAAKTKLSPQGTIYVTGYAKFWGESAQCEGVTWSLFNLRPNKVYLTLANRQKMNRLVVRVNQKIEEAVNRAGSQVVYVEYDDEFQMMGGRFCEEGVMEPDANRENIFFYQMDTVDDRPDEPGRKRDFNSPPGSFEGTIDERIEDTMNQHPDWEAESPEEAVTKIQARNPSATDAPILALAAVQSRPAVTDNADGLPAALSGLEARQLSRLVPDGVKRVFHPRPIAHNVIARLILWRMAHRRADMLGLPRDDLQDGEIASLSTCPVNGAGTWNGDAPNCSDCSQGGGTANVGSCWGGTFDGQVCCNDTPFVCTQTGCNGKDGKCQGQYQGCACTDPPAAPPPLCNEPTDGWTCVSQCGGFIPCADWCNANCASCFPVC